MTPTPKLQLQKNKIDVWLCQANTVQDQFDYFLSLLSAEELSRANRYKFEVHRNRFIISHGFRRLVLAKYLKVDPAGLIYNRGEKGKPYLSGSNMQHLNFNLSHTKDVSLLAVTMGLEIGVDIESIDRKADWKAICQRFFTQPEQRALFSLKGENQQKQAFYELWTRKEAYMKLLGAGLYLSPTEFTLTVSPQPPALIEHFSSKYKAPEEVRFAEVKLPEPLSAYRATLAVESLISEYDLYQYK